MSKKVTLALYGALLIAFILLTWNTSKQVDTLNARIIKIENLASKITESASDLKSQIANMHLAASDTIYDTDKAQKLNGNVILSLRTFNIPERTIEIEKKVDSLSGKIAKLNAEIKGNLVKRISAVEDKTYGSINLDDPEVKQNQVALQRVIDNALLSETWDKGAKNEFEAYAKNLPEKYVKTMSEILFEAQNSGTMQMLAPPPVIN